MPSLNDDARRRAEQAYAPVKAQRDRPMQYYLNKLPAELVDILPELAQVLELQLRPTEPQAQPPLPWHGLPTCTGWRRCWCQAALHDRSCHRRAGSARSCRYSK